MEENIEFHIKVSYLEIYLDTIQDLLDRKYSGSLLMWSLIMLSFGYWDHINPFIYCFIPNVGVMFICSLLSFR
jgi:hypothetical protein